MISRATPTPSISLLALAGAVGSTVVSGADLSVRFDLTPRKIEDKTGVTGLRRLGDDESLVEMARRLGHAVLARGGIEVRDVRGVFGSSNPTSDDLIPTFTAAVAQALGLSNVIADHVGVGCCGALQALRNAHNQLMVDALRGRLGHYLVVAGDHTSRILDPLRKQTGTLFGEGVAVALVTNDPGADRGYEITAIGTKSLLGEGLHSLRLQNPYREAHPPSTLPRLQMEGRRIFEFGERIIEHFLALLDLDAFPARGYLVPHQPNLRMLEAMIAHARLEPSRVYVDGIRTIGNTSAPAILLGLEDALRRRLVGPADPVVLGAFGAELQVGAALLRPIDPVRLVEDPDPTKPRSLESRCNPS